MPNPSRPAVPWVALVVVVVGLTAPLAGCGGAMSSKDAARSYAPGAAGLEEALADLDASEAEIAERFGAIASAQTRASGPIPSPQPQPPAGYAQPPAAAPAPPPPPLPGADSPAPAAEPASPTPMAQAPTDADAGDDESEEEEDRAERDAEARCELVCRALGSMRRAAEHVCRAAGPGDPRCGRARQRVGTAEQKVKEACDACDD